ncbi:marvel domain-containing protein [Boeremia exigua]|uniref:marvel domain-containing protein n=1 Tax=Boeremia exigua TaxID=749465 RepID=UPI001E8E4376|nr:marvel domain-containing protein [Boeremia exigua]KAH6620059.1 marvel domain-containing protein [Boeremia exigua]
MASTNPVITFAVRGTQVLFAMVVFGLSTTLIKGHHYGKIPSTLSFVAFVGAVSIIAALLGVASHWMHVLQGRVGVIIDAVVAVLNAAGGTLLAIKLGTLYVNPIICGGAGVDVCYWAFYMQKLLSRCKMSKADSVFLFLTAMVVGGAAALGYIRSKKEH